ncbi:DUF383-domain-containing protein [Xylona heveae TC161]|uniref:Protein HGH1 homolog n=1 Tax=Xylona heveae (strain CBS 132557 / TC161) TaxID=1328760 RepID=A0A165FNG4_XYLHT|nr:DUF383-domain-containing protein [Xylona heveae TC161]KZF21190.1 DUF383-domain-containing protein [Xylona heveae TC161]
MPTEIEELVEFLHHGNTQIRQIAAENLVGFSTAQPSLFKRVQLEPIKDLKLLVRDYGPIAKNALTMLINLSDDKEIVENLAKDDVLLESLLKRITSPKDPNANEIAMLLANMAKSDEMKRILALERDVPKDLSTSKNAMDQLMDCFVKGAAGSYNKHSDYDYLSYFFADIAKFEEGRNYFLSTRPYDSVIPLSKIVVFTEHKSHIRRKGVASTIKNVSFEVNSHPLLLSSDENPLIPTEDNNSTTNIDTSGSTGVNLLPYILLPIAGPEEFAEHESMAMLTDLQLLPPDKERDPDPAIITTHLETLLLLTTTREGRDYMRSAAVYPLVRETHLHVENEEVREACDRLVQVIMRDEEGEEKPLPPMAEEELQKLQKKEAQKGGVVGEVKEADDEETIEEVL